MNINWRKVDDDIYESLEYAFSKLHSGKKNIKSVDSVIPSKKTQQKRDNDEYYKAMDDIL